MTPETSNTKWGEALTLLRVHGFPEDDYAALVRDLNALRDMPRMLVETLGGAHYALLRAEEQTTDTRMLGLFRDIRGNIKASIADVIGMVPEEGE